MGAFDPEIELLKSRMDGSRLRPDGQSHISESTVRVFSIGVGGTAAVLTLAKRCFEVGIPEEIVLIGSAGVYPDSTDVPSLHFPLLAGPQYFTQIDLAVQLDRASIPDIMCDSITVRPGIFSAQLIRNISGRKDCVFLLETATSAGPVCNSTNSITGDSIPVDLNVPRFQNRSVMENLEAYAVAAFCEKFSIPMGCFLAITNTVGPQGSAEWQRNHVELGNFLQRVIIDGWKDMTVQF